MDLLLAFAEAGSLAFCSYTYYRWQKKHVKLQDMIDFAQRASVLSPSLLRRALESPGSEALQRSLKDFEEGRNYAKGVAFVQGVVESGQVLRSVLNHSTKLVVSTVSSELIFSNNKNFEEADGKVDTKLVSEFALADAAHPGEKVTLHAGSHIHFGDALHQIHSIVHMRSLSPLEKFLSWVLFCIKLFLSMSNVGKKLSGFKVGSKRIERGVMIGQFMIAFGEVVYDRFNRELRMNNPRYFLKEKEQLVLKLRERRVAHGRNMTLLFTVLVLVGVLVAKRAVLALKRLAGRYRALRQLGQLDQFFKTRALFANDFRCALCLERVRSVIFKPCLHLVVCLGCCEKMLERRCPQCLKAVEEVVKVFVS